MINALKQSGKALLVVGLICPQLSFADEFTSADVLAWEAEAQASFFQTSISMASIVVARTGQHDDVVACINDWYGGTEAQSERHAYIQTKLEAFPAYHPQGILLAVLEEACGGFAR